MQVIQSIEQLHNTLNGATDSVCFINPSWLLATSEEYARNNAAGKWSLIAHNALTMLSDAEKGKEAVNATAKLLYGVKPVKQRNGSTSFALSSSGRMHVKMAQHIANKVVEITAIRRDAEVQYKDDKPSVCFTEYFVEYLASVLMETYKTLGELAAEANPPKTAPAPEIVAARESKKAEAAQKSAAVNELLGNPAKEEVTTPITSSPSLEVILSGIEGAVLAQDNAAILAIYSAVQSEQFQLALGLAASEIEKQHEAA